MLALWFAGSLAMQRFLPTLKERPFCLPFCKKKAKKE
jgi:hypothetical protein